LIVRARPVFLNLVHIGMPVGALVSILHRVTGLFLVLGTPVCIYLLDLSLRGPQEFGQVRELFKLTAVRITSVMFTWVLAHHVLAGLRHLLSDIDIGSRLPQARLSAWIVNVGAVMLAALCAGVWL
jgi:succinate dehydrogenase / fumarate reductase, cytochrome b subunit